MNKEILRRLRLLISLFFVEDKELVTITKKVILGKPHQNEVQDPLVLLDFLKTALFDTFLNSESFRREIGKCEKDYLELSERFDKLSRENAWLKKQLAKRRD